MTEKEKWDEWRRKAKRKNTGKPSVAQLSTTEEPKLDIGEENKTETVTVEEEQVEKLDAEKIELERTRIIDEFISSVDLGLSFENIEKARMTPSAWSVGRIIRKFERKIETAVIRMSILGCVDEEAEDTAGLSLANCDEMNALSGGVTDDDLSLVEPSGMIRMPSAECVDGEAEDTVGLSLANCEELKTVQEQDLMRGVTDDDLSLAEPSGVIRMPSAECVDGEAENTVGLGLANCEELKNVREKDLRGGVTDDALSLAEPSGVTRMPSTECVDGETNDAAGLSLANCETMKNEPNKEMEVGVTYDVLSLAEPSRVKTNEGKMMFGKHLIMGGVNYDTLSLAEPSGVNKHEGELPSEKYCGGEVICDALSLAEPSGIDKSEGEKKFKEQLWGGVIYDDPSLAELSNENADEGGLVNNENESLSLAQSEQPGMYQKSELYMKCENASQKCAERGLAQESGLSLADGGLVRTEGGVSVADRETEVLAGIVIIAEASQNEQNKMLLKSSPAELSKFSTWSICYKYSFLENNLQIWGSVI